MGTNDKKMVLKKRRGEHRTYTRLRDPVDESLAKVRGVLALIMSMANDGRCEQEEHVANAIWLLDDELERLDERISDFAAEYTPRIKRGF